MPSHTFRRDGGIYYTRMVVPPRLRPILGTTDLGRSLRTSDYHEMKRLQAEWYIEALAKIDAAEAELVRRKAHPTADTPPYDPFAGMSEKEFDRQLAYEAEEARIASAEDDAWDEAALWEAGQPTEHPAIRLLREARRERDEYRGRYDRRKLRDQRRDRGPTPAGEPAKAKPAVTISEMFDGYAAQDGVRNGTVTQFRAIINHLIAFLGHDDARRVSHADLVRWREHLRAEPVKNGEPRSPKTINGSYLAAASVTFSYGLNQLLIENNPMRDLKKVRDRKSAKVREKDFTKAERKAILSASLVSPSDRVAAHRVLARRWVPWICAYTGARVNELTQLRAEDVLQVEGHWSLRITPEAGSTKTNEYRLVPLHEHLIEQGFLAAIKGKRGPLFYVPTENGADSRNGPHKRIGMWLAEWVRKDVGITDEDILPNHAWRHTFKTICREVQIDEWASDAITGHASKAQGRKYGSNTIPALAAQLQKFPRFDLSD